MCLVTKHGAGDSYVTYSVCLVTKHGAGDSYVMYYVCLVTKHLAGDSYVMYSVCLVTKHLAGDSYVMYCVCCHQSKYRFVLLVLFSCLTGGVSTASRLVLDATDTSCIRTGITKMSTERDSGEVPSSDSTSTRLPSSTRALQPMLGSLQLQCQGLCPTRRLGSLQLQCQGLCAARRGKVYNSSVRACVLPGGESIQLQCQGLCAARRGKVYNSSARACVLPGGGKYTTPVSGPVCCQEGESIQL